MLRHVGAAAAVMLPGCPLPIPRVIVSAGDLLRQRGDQVEGGSRQRCMQPLVADDCLGKACKTTSFATHTLQIHVEFITANTSPCVEDAQHVAFGSPVRMRFISIYTPESLEKECIAMECRRQCVVASRYAEQQACSHSSSSSTPSSLLPKLKESVRQGSDAMRL